MLAVLFFCLSVIFALAHWVSGGTLLVWLAVILPKGSASTVILTKAPAIIAWLKGCIVHFSFFPWWLQWTKANILASSSITISRLLAKSDESRKYDAFINKFRFKSWKDGVKARTILDSIRSDIIKEAQKVEINEITDEWFAAQLLTKLTPSQILELSNLTLKLPHEELN